MNANLPLKAPAIKDWLRDAATQLADAGISSAKLDAEIILSHTIRQSRTYLHAHDDQQLSLRHLEIADARLQLRIDRTPVAYIVGHKEFYGRLFKVNPATLVPRPESETIITILKELTEQMAFDLGVTTRLVDVGTGSGCLGITAKLEIPELEVTLLDVSRQALKVAESNAEQLQAKVIITRSDLLQSYPFLADYIIANLPYVDPEWERSPETNYEPAMALFATDEGLALINKLLQQAPSQLNSGGYILLEADPRQHAAIIATAKHHHLSLHEVRDLIVVLQKTN
ncbi:MAG TPA: peptide chain release factor N(5)-glutamine methyltransferase [Candidatus Saccharimonadales bacterium]|jgi:release factor glutamine methyltransferase|nr:peptide chain release factor N(5)-glutamine methyltransferase [Candidatus Saccharimonadales bacterium]